MKRNIFLLFLTTIVVTVWGQTPQIPKLPTDAETRIGKLSNGLTYYIRHNEYPANVANFYIAQRVGSIQENDDQRGLAHFLEHMAFNGSEHFPGNGIIDYTRSLGVAFGQDLNAYTSIEQTVYNIDNVPTTRQTALDSCLLILKDWSNGLELNGDEIDKERGVIHGEWAMRNSAMQRLIERNLPVLYPGCKYGERLPIGTMEIIDNFPHDALRKYYQKWYHPENQAIIVIGDIDVNHTESQIKTLFSEIKAGPEAAHVADVTVPDNEDAILISDKDTEMQYSIMSIMLKSDPLPSELVGTQMELATDYIMSAISLMFNNRMTELAQDPNCPFNQLSMSYGSYLLSKTKDALDFTAVAKDGKERESYAALVREIKRMADFGFTPGEYFRAKQEMLSQLEKEHSNKDKRKHSQYYEMCVNNYLDGKAMMDADMYYQLMQAIVQNLSLEIINQTLKQNVSIEKDHNLASYTFAQEKEGANYMSTVEMKHIIDEVRAEELTAWVDSAKDEPLIGKAPKVGKIKKETKNETLGYTELILSNGSRVILKKTDFKNDEVILNGYAPGGQCLYGEGDFINLKAYNDVVSTFGLGNFSNNELQKKLAGRQASVSLSLDREENRVSGSSTPKDIETMLQLIYLSFTSSQKDEKAFQTYISMLETQLKNRDLMPETQLSDSIQALTTNYSKRTKNLVVGDLKDISLDRCMEITRQRFSNANNFVFTIIGNFDDITIKPLICQYIASLPGKEKNIKTTDIRQTFHEDKVCEFKRKMLTPKPYIVQIYKSEGRTTQQQRILSHVSGEVLSMILLKTVREDAGAAYSVGAMGYTNRALNSCGQDYTLMQVYAPISAPEKVDLALDLMHKGIEEICACADADMVSKVKANLVKELDVNAKKNSYWMQVIDTYLHYNEDSHSKAKEIAESITPEQVSTHMRNVTNGKHVIVVMRPE